MEIKSVNPVNGSIIEVHKEYSSEEIQQKIHDTHQAWTKWRKVGFSDKAKPMLKLAKILRDRKKEIGQLVTLEMGKALKESIAEVEKCASVCEYYAHNAEAFLKDNIVETDARV